MNRKELEKYEHIRNVASRDWLSASSVSLAKLDQIKASVYNVSSTVTDTQSLKPRARSSHFYRRKKTYTEIDTEPPLSRLSYQKTAWGSNNSIPELIRQQGERIQRPESAKVSRRPWSGRKVPPSPSSQQRKPVATENAVPADQSGIPIVVKGERYDPRSRPPSGAPQFGVPSGGVAVGHTHEDLDQISKEKIENTLEEFVNSQPNANIHNLAKLSAAYAKEEAVSPPPPPPCASPDIARMINGGSETSDDNGVEGRKSERPTREELKIDLNIGGHGDDDDDDDGDVGEDREKPETYTYKEINVKQSPRTLLLRRPTPEPMTFSIPTGKESSDEDDLDTARLLNGGTAADDLEVESVGLDNGSEPGSPHSDANKYTDITLSSRSINGVVGGRPVTRATVTIAEDRNITVDITPRSPKSPRRRSKMMKRRPKSATSVNDVDQEIAGDVMAENSSRYHVRTTHPSVRRRPVSAKARLATSTVSVDYGDTDGKAESEQLGEMNVDQLEGNTPSGTVLTEKPRRIRKKKEIETLMAHISISDNEDEKEKENDDNFTEMEDTVKTSIFGYQKSSSHSATRNYYEIAMETSVGKTSGVQDSTRQTQKFKTIKTIEFGETEPKETKTITAIGQPPDVNRHGNKSDVEDSEAESIHKSHSSIRRPHSAKKVVARHPSRPTSRMEHRPDLPKPVEDEVENKDDLKEADDSIHKSEKPIPVKLSVRPFSAPHRRVHDSSRRPHSPRKVKHRPKSATTSTMNTKCNQTSQVIVPSKISYAEHKRNREAVKALKDGSLFKEKPVAQVVPDADAGISRPYLGKQKEEKKKKPKVWVYETNEGMIMDDGDEIEMQNLHDALQEKGVNVSVHTLKRGLMPPREKGYTECLTRLPPSSANTLLSHPEEWLGEVFQKYKLAEKALEKANVRMIEQEELEAKMLAAAMQAKARKKKKVGKKRKVKPKRASSAKATRKEGDVQ